MQYVLSIDIPDSGILFDDMHFADGSTVPKGRFIQPRIEAEIAFVMKEGLDGAATRAQALSATDYVYPSLEILDNVFCALIPRRARPARFLTLSQIMPLMPGL